VVQTAAHRDDSPAAYAAWVAAVEAWHKAYDSMYPREFFESLREIPKGSAKAIDEAITFLEADPWCFRSGYVKAAIVRRLGSMAIGDDNQRRLRKVIMQVIDAGDRREFRWYARLGRRLDGVELREALIQRLASAEPGVRRRALWTLEALPYKLPIASHPLAQQVIIDAGFDPQGWRVTWWRRQAARKYEDQQFRQRLVTIFREGEPAASDAALKILCELREAGLGAEDYPRLRARILSGVDRDDFDSYVATARIPGVASPALVRQLSDRLHGDDKQIAMRAGWALRELGS